jgi:SAM-dependent methyltransferase
MRLRQRIPKGWTLGQVLQHYRVEKQIADRLRRSSRDERKAIYLTMYDELFREIPWHPRLARRADERLTRIVVERKWNLVSPYVGDSTVFAEFGPGDCRFALDVAAVSRRVYGIDISDQRGDSVGAPPNFRLIIYDGYEVDLPDGSIDVVFSDQLLEHLHPDDTPHHLALVRRLLRTGGVYVVRTPHAYTGPHDISKFFSAEPEGFHLREWTFTDLFAALREAGFRSVAGLLTIRGRPLKMPGWFFGLVERPQRPLPPRLRRVLSWKLLSSISVVATK